MTGLLTVVHVTYHNPHAATVEVLDGYNQRWSIGCQRLQGSWRVVEAWAIGPCEGINESPDDAPDAVRSLAVATLRGDSPDPSPPSCLDYTCYGGNCTR